VTEPDEHSLWGRLLELGRPLHRSLHRVRVALGRSKVG